MWLILLEALAALALLLFLVWWTMFSGRRPPAHDAVDEPAGQAPSPPDHTDPRGPQG